LTEDGWRDQTWDHIQMVQSLLTAINNEINNRAAVHDHVKLQQPESAIFAKYTCRLRGMTYGSDEYNECLKEMKPALDHHYAHTKHHPEHYQNGVNSMTLVDLVEMLADWKAATLRHADGDIMKSLEINKKRFGLSDQLVQILLNTVKEMGWD